MRGRIEQAVLGGADIPFRIDGRFSTLTLAIVDPVAVDRLGLAKAEIAAAIAAPASSRGGKISNAVSRIENARDQIGANVTFTMGQGNLMF